MEKDYIRKENDLHQKIGTKAVKDAQKNRAATRVSLETAKGRADVMARIFSKEA